MKKNGDSARIEGECQKIGAINRYCIDQMKMCTGRDDEYNQGISLVASKIHNYILRTVADEMDNLRIIDEVGD